jgi:hypothetical protein
MKTIFTLLFVLFIGVAAQAQNANEQVEKDSVDSSAVSNTIEKEVSMNNDNSVARLYMFKNSKIKKELSFATKLNKAKLA